MYADFWVRGVHGSSCLELPQRIQGRALLSLFASTLSPLHKGTKEEAMETADKKQGTNCAEVGP
jgi:hypothetical protein